MSFLVLVPLDGSQTDPSSLLRLAGASGVAWFDPEDRTRGGAVCLSPLATMSRFRRGDSGDCLIVGRIRLDRREELRASLAVDCLAQASDADLCLLAYIKWGEEFVEHIHGDFAFVIYDHTTRKLICARDRFGVRMLAWSRRGNSCWLAGSMQDLCASSAIDTGPLDPVWIADFLRSGFCEDAARSAYANISRLPAAHLLSIGRHGIVVKRYCSLEVAGPLYLKSPSDYLEEFHCHLDAAMRDRLPSDRVGLMMSGGLDSSTLAAKATELGAPDLKVFVRTWLVGLDADPEAQASARVAEFLGLEQTCINADDLRFDPNWSTRAITLPEPGFAALRTPDYLADLQSMRTQAACWFYGEGPDNALTFEWRMHLQWLARRREWGRLSGAVTDYLMTKSASDWKTSLKTILWRGRHRQSEDLWQEPAWVRGGSGERPAQSEPLSCDWRPRAHGGLASSLWPSMFEGFEADGNRVGIEWRHPFMDLRVLEFLLATPPIPWARRKLLFRRAMRGRLPEETLRRPKTPLHRDGLAELLRQHLPAMPRSGDAIEDFVDLARLPENPASHPDVYALTRVAILQHWLKVRHG